MCRRSLSGSTACAPPLSPGFRPPNGARPSPPYVALADGSPQGIAGFTAGAAWAPALGALAPKTVLAAGELLMLPNGKPDRLAMTVRLTELHQGK